MNISSALSCGKLSKHEIDTKGGEFCVKGQKCDNEYIKVNSKLTFTSGKLDTSSFDPCPVTQRPNISTLYLILSELFLLNEFQFSFFIVCCFVKNLFSPFVWNFLLNSARGGHSSQHASNISHIHSRFTFFAAVNHKQWQSSQKSPQGFHCVISKSSSSRCHKQKSLFLCILIIVICCCSTAEK